MHLTAEDIAQATNGVWFPQSANGERVISSVSTDTRTLVPGDLFIALKGEHFDAHEHLDKAIANGASGIVVQEEFDSKIFEKTIPVLKVNDPLHALGDIAAAWRRRCPATCVAIVGSSGKTTTKEMLAAILDQAAPTLVSAGNYNNLIGAPLTLLGLTREHRWGVLELGMNLPGELTRLAEIVSPDLLLIVNVGTAHIGQFGSQAALLEAKSEAIRALPPTVPVIFNSTCDNSRQIVRQWGGDHPLSTFAIDQPAEMWARKIEIEKGRGYVFDLQAGACGFCATKIHLPVFGRFNVANAVAAAAAANLLGVDIDRIRQGLESFSPTSLRSELKQVGGVTLIVDCYNANPNSMSAALDSLAELPSTAGKTFLVLGDMLELGEESTAYHDRLGRQVANLGVDGLFVMGCFTPALVKKWKGPRDCARHFDTHEDLAQHLIKIVHNGDRLFFKGSRGNRLEVVVRRIEDYLSTQRPEI